KPSEHFPVPVSENDLLTIPEPVQEIFAVMDDRIQWHSLGVNRIAPKDFMEEVKRHAKPIIRFIHGGIASVRVALDSRNFARQGLRILGVVDCTFRFGGRLSNYSPAWPRLGWRGLWLDRLTLNRSYRRHGAGRFRCDAGMHILDGFANSF